MTDKIKGFIVQPKREQSRSASSLHRQAVTDDQRFVSSRLGLEAAPPDRVPHSPVSFWAHHYGAALRTELAQFVTEADRDAVGIRNELTAMLEHVRRARSALFPGALLCRRGRARNGDDDKRGQECRPMGLGLDKNTAGEIS